MIVVTGGAANAAVNVASLGGDVLLAGVVGADSTAEKLDSLLRDVGIDTAGLKVVNGRATTLKTRVIAHHQQVVRVDREVGGPIDKAIVDDIIEYMLDSLAEVDGLLISDYAKGVSAPDVVSKGIAAAKALGKPVVVDPKGSDFSKYSGATVITPNHSEAVEASGVEISDDASVVLAGETLVREVGCDAVLITRGENGMSLFDEDGLVTHLPTFARAVYDVTGAGDTVAGTLALALALALATGAKFADCARIANIAAGVVVGKVGTAVLTAEELQSSLGRSGT